MSRPGSVRSTAELDAALVSLLADMHAAGADADMSPACVELLRQVASTLHEARHALRIEQARYRALFDAVPDPVSILAYDGTVLDLNKAGVRAYNREREDIVGKSIEVLNPDLPRDHMAPVLEALGRGDSYVIEVTNMRADGTRFPVEVHSASLVFDGHDAIVAVARDLSARQEAEARYHSLVEGIDKAIVLQDRDGRVHYMNAAAMRIYGLMEAQASPPDWNDWLVIDADGRPMPYQAQPAAVSLATGRVVASQVLGLFRRSTQRLLWLSVTTVPQFAPGADHAEMVLSLASDVTELQRDKVLFDRVQELARIGAWQWDRATGALHMTEEARRILGMAGPPGGMNDLLACLGDRDARMLRATLEAIRDGTGFDLELRGNHEVGAASWLRFIGEPDAHDPGNDRISGTVQDVSERKRDEDVLRVQAQTDTLTGLMNRDAILARIESRLRETPTDRIALLYIDLDRFKIVNDVLGHHAGDALLVGAANRIRGAVDGEGLIARFGGDEFLVACNATHDPERPARLAQRIQHAFAASFRLAGNEFSVTSSIGIALASDDVGSAAQLIQRADVAMYDSKRRSRAGFQLFSPELAARQQERLQTETQLRRALDNEEFHLVYQPQVDLRSGRILQAEALVRWRNPLLGELRPDRFIELAETTGDIVRIGHWVLQEACSQMRRWRDQGLAVQRIAVNVSYRQILGEDLGERVRKVLAETGLPGSMLELELTERVLVEDAVDTRVAFEKLRALGVQLSIDDFGEGYSALNYLRRLPIQALKLSHAFMKGVPQERSDVAICQAVAGIARSLGLGVVAEGIEHEAQRQFLLDLGITVGQGFLFAPGLAAEEFADLFAAQAERP